MKIAEQALTEVLNIVRRYLPPDGISIQDAMSEIIACVDPWPLDCPDPQAAPVAAEPSDEMDLVCYSTPPGWRCTRGVGHDGPCAAVEDLEELSLVARGMQRLREAAQRPAPKVDLRPCKYVSSGRRPCPKCGQVHFGVIDSHNVEHPLPTPQAAPVAASPPDLGALTRYEHYCSYDGGGGADEEVEADGSWVRYDDVVKLLSATQLSPQAAPVAAAEPALLMFPHPIDIVASMTVQAKARTSGENIADVLLAIAQQVPAPPAASVAAAKGQG